MRTLLKVTTDVTAANAALVNGSLPGIIKETMDRLNPEAAYFLTENGTRACLMVFDLKDVSDIPSIAEPFFLQLKAKVEFSPVMNAEELQKGLKAMAKPQFEMMQ